MDNMDDEMNVFRYGVSYVTRRPVAKGDIGIEVEVEGRNLPRAIGNGKTWKVEGDNSLRGESFEYVFNGPKPRADVDKNIDELWKVFKDTGSHLNNSHRTSVHVHLNMSDKTVGDVVKLFTLYSIVEDFVLPYCGNTRLGNLFCLRVRDATFVCEQMARALRRDDFGMLNTDNIRYSSINLNALFKYGSVEFRAMRGLTEPETLKKWVGMLFDIYDAAMRYESPRKMVENLSMLGIEGFLQDIFRRDNYDTLLKTCNEHNVDIASALFDGVRRVQGIAYTNDDKFRRGLELYVEDQKKGVNQFKADPFKVEMKKMRVGGERFFDAFVQQGPLPAVEARRRAAHAELIATIENAHRLAGQANNFVEQERLANLYHEEKRKEAVRLREFERHQQVVNNIVVEEQVNEAGWAMGDPEPDNEPDDFDDDDIEEERDEDEEENN